jgi:hypothetical protein
MGKKVIKLTETQMKRIIEKVIQEQTAPAQQKVTPTQPSQPKRLPFKHTQTGEQFNAPYIKSDEDLSHFVNFGSGGSWKSMVEILKSHGLDLTSEAEQSMNSMKQNPEKGPQGSFSYILKSIWAFLHTVAKYNIAPKTIYAQTGQILQKMDEKDINKDYASNLPVIIRPDTIGYDMKQYWSALTKLAETQINKLGGANTQQP